MLKVMNADEISENLRNSVCHCVPPIMNDKPLESLAWKTWHWIVDDDEEKIDGEIACIHCLTVQDYDSKNGTTNLLKHEVECLNTERRKSLANLSNIEIQSIKSSVNEKVIQFVAQDMLSFRATSFPGLHALADRLISIGHRYGPVKTNEILPRHTTISKLDTKDADKKKINLKSKIVEFRQQGLAVTLDLWTEDITKCHYIGIKVHYITKGVLSEATLCVKELDELSAKAEDIHIKIANMLDAYGLDINNIIFVSDRDGESITALRDYACRLTCAAHILKNIVDEMLNKIGDENPVSLLENCLQLVTYIKRYRIQHRLPNGLKNEVPSRWNATLLMLKSIKKTQETNDLFEFLELKEKTYLLTDIDMDLLAYK